MINEILNFLFGRGALNQASQQGAATPQQAIPQNAQNPGISIQQIMAMAQQQADDERRRKMQEAMMKSKIGNVPAMLQQGAQR